MNLRSYYYIDQESALKIITSQYFGTCYYAAPVWLTDQLFSQSWKRLNNQHFRAIRAAVMDKKNKIPRAMLDIISKRARPRQWANQPQPSSNCTITQIPELQKSCAAILTLTSDNRDEDLLSTDQGEEQEDRS